MSGLTRDVRKVIVDIINELYSQSKTEGEIASVLMTFKIGDRYVCSLLVLEFKARTIAPWRTAPLGHHELLVEGKRCTFLSACLKPQVL